MRIPSRLAPPTTRRQIVFKRNFLPTNTDDRLERNVDDRRAGIVSAEAQYDAHANDKF
jgi:hypothetical protein